MDIEKAQAKWGKSTRIKRHIYQTCKKCGGVGAVVWHSGLTSENTTNIERVQKCALSVILGKDYQNYENALSTLQLEKLCIRREALCVQYAKKSPKVRKVLLFLVCTR